MPARRRPNLIDKLRRSLSPPARGAFDALAAAARDQRLPLFAVGGTVRDLLLDRPTLDVDLVVEGDAPALARRSAAGLADVRCRVHPAFGTASLAGAGFRFDVASARAETYARPGALPTVTPGSLHDDLRRRDFTLNAIAAAIDSHEIIDPFGGQADLEARLLRVLHEGSFRDDATRILRAARYEARLGLRIESETLRWLRRDVSYLRTISGARLRQELARVCDEAEPERAILRLDELGALKAIQRPLTFDAPQAKALARLRRLRPDPPQSTSFALLAWRLSARPAAALAERLSLNRREREALLAAPALRRLEHRLAGAKPSRAVGLLAPFPTAAVWALAAADDGPPNEAALRYLRRWRNVKPLLDGHALQAIGARPGPRLGEVLRRLKAAKLDGEVRSRRDEERLARRLLDTEARR
jgi:tRNA nucleotidyltransferase (CCA-adding enzyme)